MRKQKQYIVDAFTDRVFAGNPAAVCVMDSWLDDATMQDIAMENNYSETAFTVRENGRWHLRWFTPGGEVELCGHATMATAYVILNFVEPDAPDVSFDTLSGVLTVSRDGDLLSMDFPSNEMKEVEVTDELEKAIGVRPVKAFYGADMVCVLENEDQVRAVVPDLDVISGIDGVCFHVTARGEKYDCVTRTFAPKCGVVEDPVCGRAHCHVVPLWSEILGKKEIAAYQASERGGELFCRSEGDRTIISGKAALFSEGEIYF